MKTAPLGSLLPLAGAAAWLAAAPPLHAYPPAPHHLIEGVVRDGYGNPLTTGSARLVLETTSGKQLTARLRPEMGRGLNYTLTIPMDAGITPDAYRPTALQPLVPFRIKVFIGSSTFLPLEMTGDLAHLGQPAQRTRLDLTLGEDTDGDGLPDAWERALLQMLGGQRTLADIRPEDDLDGDGLTNLQEYLAGTYAYDPAHGIQLELLQVEPGRAFLEFTVVTGRTYRVLAADALNTWTPVPFQVVGASEGPVTEYRAGDVRLLRVEVAQPDPEGARPHRFFKLHVQ